MNYQSISSCPLQHRRFCVGQQKLTNIINLIHNLQPLGAGWHQKKHYPQHYWQIPDLGVCRVLQSAFINHPLAAPRSPSGHRHGETEVPGSHALSAGTNLLGVTGHSDALCQTQEAAMTIYFRVVSTEGRLGPKAVTAVVDGGGPECGIKLPSPASSVQENIIILAGK